MKSFKLALVGDIFPANLGYNSGFGVASKFLRHNGLIWEDNLKNILNDTDLVFGNLESPLVCEKEYSDNNNFAGHSSFAKFLKRNKIEIVSIANNHILEQGIDGFKSTCEILEKNKIKCIGKNVEELSNIEIIEKNDIRIGFCGFNAIHDIRNLKAYAELSEQNLFKTIEMMNNLDLDYRIVSLHWGNEYIHYPSKQQIELAHKIIDSNIDIIVGHHPHVIQPIEEYRNGLIFYSFGNFLFDMLWSEKVRHGIVANLIFTKENFEYKILNIRLSDDYAPNINLKGNKKLMKINATHSLNLMKLNKYEKSYSIKAKKDKLIQRILMKKELVKNWGRISEKSKKEFITKLKDRIYAK